MSRYDNLTTEALLRVLARVRDGRRRNQITRVLSRRGVTA